MGNRLTSYTEAAYSNRIMTDYPILDAKYTLEGIFSGTGEYECSIHGNHVIWSLSAPSAARTLYVENFDPTSGDYIQNYYFTIIKCNVDCSVNNIKLKTIAGALLHTFNTDCSVTPEYVVLKLNASDAWVKA